MLEYLVADSATLPGSEFGGRSLRCREAWYNLETACPKDLRNIGFGARGRLCEHWWKWPRDDASQQGPVQKLAQTQVTFVPGITAGTKSAWAP